jgi:lipid A 3-O-deacylase
VETSARVGGTLRFGWQIPNDFGPQIIDSITTTEGGWESSTTAGRWGFYGFVGGQAKAVGYDAFLEGNLYYPGPHVDKEMFVGEWYGGFAAVLRRVELGFTYVVHTKTFNNQLGQDAYGSVYLKARL